MGLSQPVTASLSGHFLRKEPEDHQTVDELDQRDPWTTNHPSFDETHGGSRSPAWDLLETQVNEGFALLFEDHAAASRYLGAPCHPSPLGNVSKVKDNGELKHRLIQDLRANGVNETISLPERQVLPRGLDHGIDLAVLGENRSEGVEVHTLVLDFKNAFMTIPLHPDERRFTILQKKLTGR